MQADIRFEHGACHSFSIDFTIGCAHNCAYCYFSAMQKAAFRNEHKTYRGEIIALETSELLSRSRYPAQIYLSNATDPFADQAAGSSHRVLARLLPDGIQFFIVTKGIIPDDTVELLDRFGSQVSVQVGLTSLSTERNKIVEPGAPSAEKRLELLKKLKQTNIAVVAARMDPLFPGIDDDDDALHSFVDAISQTKTSNIIASYVLLTSAMKRRLGQIPSLSPAIAMLTEKAPTISSNDLYSAAIEYKLERLSFIRNLCLDRGIRCNTCACKDRRLASTTLPFVCHPRDTDSFLGNYVSPGQVSEFIDLI